MISFISYFYLAISTYWTCYTKFVSSADHTSLSTGSVTETQKWNCCFKAIWRFYCVLPCSENFLSSFPLAKFSFYWPNFCGKKYSNKSIERQQPLTQYIIQVFVLEYNNDKQNKKKKTLNGKKGVLLSLVTEGFLSQQMQ